MSTRFVWEKTTFRLVRGDNLYWVDFPEYAKSEVYVSENYIINNDGTFSLDPSKPYVRLGSDEATETSIYPYMFPSQIRDINFKSPTLHKARPASDYPNDTIFWYKLSDRTYDKHRAYTCLKKSGADIIYHEIYSCNKGTLVGKTTGPSQGPYLGHLRPWYIPLKNSRRCAA